MSIQQDAGVLLAASFYSASEVALLPVPRSERPLSFYQAACRAFPHGSKLLLKRLRYVARAWRERRLHEQWLRFLDAPHFAAAAERLPQLYAKIQRTYVVRDFDVAARVRLLQDHYRGFFSATRGFADALHSRPGLPLWSFGSAPQTYQLRLCHLPPCWREGEISLALFDAARPICSLTFVVSTLREFTCDDGGKTVVVGGIQGLHDAEGLQIFRQLTKSMHGLRPFSLLAHAIRAVAPALGAQRVLAVGDAQHALAEKRIRNKVRISYDAIWSDHGGSPIDGGMFDLGLDTPCKPMADIPSHKRAQYRRRYQMMDEMIGAIRNAAAAASR